jgi:hypothetical protein
MRLLLERRSASHWEIYSVFRGEAPVKAPKALTLGMSFALTQAPPPHPPPATGSAEELGKLLGEPLGASREQHSAMPSVSNQGPH